MTREEAIETIRRCCPRVGDSQCDFETAMRELIPELRESVSEDERTRRELVKFISDIKSISESGRTTWAIRSDDAKMCETFLAYLEKQKEQKPAEWSEEDEDAITTAIRACKYITENFENSTKQYEDAIERLKSLRPQLKEEWSEEDETKLRDVVRLVEDSGHVKSIREHYEKFLTSLPERFNLRPEQWSEEDEKIMQTIIKEGDLKPSEIAWLKSLRPQPHWKPSEEQMVLLRKVYNLIWADQATPADIQDGLGDFIEQLKTL